MTDGTPSSGAHAGANAGADPVAIPVAIVGAAGRMGRFTADLLAAADGFEVVARYRRGDDWTAALPASGAAVTVDFTVAGRGYEHGSLILAAGSRPLIGTSGVTPDEVRALDAQARELELGGAVVPNFSLGIWALNRAALAVASHFEKAEIVETHHEHKRDAPSATSADTARRIQRAQRVGDVEGRAVPIHSLRLPGHYAHQEVVFGSAGESLTIRHDMAGPEAFGPGLLAALAFVRSARRVVHGLDAILADGEPAQ